MAKLVGVFNTAHSPFCYVPPEWWNGLRAQRNLREDVPMDTLEENQRKSRRLQAGFATLRAKLTEAAPDAIVVFGDDQLECFDFNNFPGMAVYVGEEFEGYTSSHDVMRRNPNPGEKATPEKRRVKNHRELAIGILTGLMQHDFDPAYCMDMPKPERGVGHAILRPAESLTDFSLPIVPVLLNCYYAPQPTAKRCYQLGRAVREIIDDFPGDLRVAVVGSGGMWHTPGAQTTYLDEDFDRTELAFLEAGDIRGMAEFFDAYRIPEGDVSQDVLTRGHGATGMPYLGGPQGGTREICNWIAAGAVADGSRETIVDYVPIYASPVGTAFAYTTDI